MSIMQDAPSTFTNQTPPATQTPTGQGAILAQPPEVRQAWLYRFAEPIASHVRWWTLVVAIIGIGIGVLSSFGYTLSTNLALNILLSLITFAALIIGVGCLARFVLDVIITRRAGRRVRQRAVEHTV